MKLENLGGGEIWDHINIKKKFVHVLVHLKEDQSPWSDEISPRLLWKAGEIGFVFIEAE